MCDACPHVCKRGWKRLTPRSGGVVEKFSSCTVLPRLNTFKSYNSNPELKQNLFHVRQISRKEECTCHKPNQTQNLCNSVLFYSELIFISASHITEIKSCLQVDTLMQRWLQRCSRRGKNRCFRQIFRYSWMQLISFEWIWLRVQGKSNIFRIDRQLHLVDCRQQWRSTSNWPHNFLSRWIHNMAVLFPDFRLPLQLQIDILKWCAFWATILSFGWENFSFNFANSDNDVNWNFNWCVTFNNIRHLFLSGLHSL